jgi:hypothetical protein
MIAIGPSEYPRVVEISGFAVHGDLGLGPLQPVGPVEGSELTALVGVHDLGRAELVDRLVQRLEAELGLQRVGDASGQHLAGEPVHVLRRLKAIAYRPKDGHQIEEAFPHRQVSDVGTPDLVGPVDPQPAQQL